MEGKNVVITISRQYGSGGNEIGHKLAHELGMNFYDKNILRMNSEVSGIEESHFHRADEKAGDNLFYRMKGLRPLASSLEKSSFGLDRISADNLFRFQSEVIRSLAEHQSCVIVGRCADYILRDMESIELLRVYIYADMETRVERITKMGLFQPEEVKKNIKRMDKERRVYSLYYTGREWAVPEDYDLMINEKTIGMKGAVRMIEEYIKTKGFL